MPISLIDQNGDRVGYGGDAPIVDDPPAPPTGLSAVAGNASVTLTWDASTEPDLEDYRVRTVSPTDSLVAVVPAGTTTYTDTGLTNGVTYQYVIRARDAAGNVSTDSASDSATPTGTVEPTGTIFGYNTADDAPLSSRLVKWANRAPCVRRYQGSFLSSGSFPITTAVAPEKRVAYSFKADSSGSYTKAGLAAGNGNARLTAFCEDIPTGWTVFLTYYHEPNDDIRDGTLSVANYRGAYTQFRQAIDAATLKAGVTVKLVSNFMAYRVAETAYFSDSWVPPEADLMTFDLYGNPGHFTTSVKTTTGTTMQPNCGSSTGLEYVSSLPPIATRFKDALAAIVRNGYKDNWGLLEYNTPPRDWDGPANPDYACGSNKRLRYEGGRNAQGQDTSNTEVARAAWLKDGVDYCLEGPVILGQKMSPPAVWLFWEHPSGVNWNQKFYNDRVWNTLKPYLVGSP